MNCFVCTKESRQENRLNEFRTVVFVVNFVWVYNVFIKHSKK